MVVPSCPVFVGRDAEIAALLAGVNDSTTAVSTRAALVRGEAGIGKTRLVDELRARASRASVQVTCTEPGRSLPFGALRDLLRARGVAVELREDRPSRKTESEAARAELKARLHASLVDAVDAVVADDGSGAGLLVVEDIHWADDATLEWLPHLARTGGPMLLVLTFREGRSDLAFARCLVEIERLRPTPDVRLGPMPRADIVTLVELTATTSAADREEIADLADGNPLFAEELVGRVPRRRDRWDRSHPLPHVVQLTFDERNRALSDHSRDLMRVAAAWGRDFSAEHLTRLAGDPAGDVHAGIDELLRVGLVVAAGPGWFAFRHALIRSAAYASMSHIERHVVHRRIAIALEAGLAGRPELRAAELAQHWSLAGDTQRMAVWAASACEEALLAHSPEQAVDQATRSIEAFVRLRGEAPHELLRCRGEAHSWLGRFAQARADHEAAVHVARVTGDARQQWRSLVDLGILDIEEDFSRAGGRFDDALTLAREIDDDRGRAESLSWVGFWHMMGGDPPVALAHQQEALTLLRDLEDDRAQGEILDLMGWTNYVGADLPASRDAYRKGVELNRAIGASQGLASCLGGFSTRGADCFQLDSVWCDGEPLAWAVDARHAVEYARSIGWRSGEARTLIWLGLHLAALGQHRAAFDCARRGLEIAVEDRQVRFESTAHILYNALWLDLHNLERALEHGTKALALGQSIRSATVAATAASFLARAQIAAGRLEAASVTLDELESVAPNSMPHRLLGSAGAELDLARGENSGALRRVDALVRDAPRAGRDDVIPRLWHLRGVALSGLGRCDEADTCLAEAASAAKRLRQRPVLWRVLATAGHAMLVRGAHETAGDCFRAARRVVRELAASIDDPVDAATFVGAATRLVPLPPDREAGWPPLTAREREVAAFVARGMTNREIADHFVLSTRTVEKHVANALTKLGMRSRVELAVWAAGHAP